MRMMSISLIVVSYWLSLFAQPDGVQLDIQKHFGVPQPKRLFATECRISYGPEGGLVSSELFLISKDSNYFYISFGSTYPQWHIYCYNRNGRLVSNYRVRSVDEMMEGDIVSCASIFDDNKLCFLLERYRRIPDKDKYEKVGSFEFLVFTPEGKIDKKSTDKLNRMIKKLNSDNKISPRSSMFNAMIIDDKDSTIDLFGITPDGYVKLRIFPDGNYSTTTVDRFPIIDSQGNIVSIEIKEKEKPNEIIIKKYRRDREYKNIDEVKIKIDETIAQHIRDKIYVVNFAVDARGHIFIAFPIKKSLIKTEWQIEKYDYGIERADIVMKYPGYVVYEFAPTGQPIGPRALLQTIVDNLFLPGEDEDNDLRSGNRFKLDDQGNLYYLRYQPDSTEIWMVPSSSNAK